MPDLRAFLGSGRAELQRGIHLPTLGENKGHIGPVDALPDSAPELMVSILGKARAEPAQQQITSTLEIQGRSPAQTNSNPLVRLRLSLR